MSIININCSKNYNIHITNDLINHLKQYLINLNIGESILVISDDIVFDKYGKTVIEQLNNDYIVKSFVFEHGESSKNISNLLAIISFLADNNYKRNDSIIALGGGVVGDISGLASSLYMRGINFIQIPTTLLAMVDASVGGKTAIDIKQGKNMVGTFYQPRIVLCDPDIIKNLPKDIFNEGMAEVIKYNIINNNSIISYINNNVLFDKLNEIIETCIKIKAEIVNNDEFETKGLRRCLNAGHTFGHSLEKASNYSISHGNAVGTGLIYESLISCELGLCNVETVEIIKKAIIKYDLLIDFDYSFDQLINNMKMDKKNTDSKISFIMPVKLGEYVDYKINKSDLLRILERIGYVKKD